MGVALFLSCSFKCLAWDKVWHIIIVSIICFHSSTSGCSRCLLLELFCQFLQILQIIGTWDFLSIKLVSKLSVSKLNMRKIARYKEELYSPNWWIIWGRMSCSSGRKRQYNRRRGQEITLPNFKSSYKKKMNKDRHSWTLLDAKI